MRGDRRERRILIGVADADILDAETCATRSVLAGDREMKANDKGMNFFSHASYRRESGWQGPAVLSRSMHKVNSRTSGDSFPIRGAA